MIGPPLDQREAAWQQAHASTVDVLVVGGGINGVGIALDAASRGLSTVLVERDDLAVGTSSRSSKLIHGGLRYLEQYRFGLVREALAERQSLMHLAPHIVGMERFLVPVLGGWWQTPYIAAGLALYDGLGGRRGGRFSMVSRHEAIRRVPSLRNERLRAAFEYSDGVFDDARLAVAVARTARSVGAVILTRAEMLETDDAPRGIGRASVRDILDGEIHELAVRTVVDATGAFSTDAGVVPSRGVHLLVPRDRIASETGLTIRVPGRVIFLIPWLGNWLIGTTDVPHRGPIDRPRADADEVAYLLDELRAALDVDLETGDIISTFAGIRPLAGGRDHPGDTASLTREERIDEPRPGVFALRGGKYTTYRRVAARVVDRVADRLGRGGPSTTAGIPLVGAAPAPALEATAGALVGQGWEPEVARRLVMRHGSEAPAVAASALALGLDATLVPGLPYLAVEAWWAAHHEQALGVDDVLARRTRVALEDRGHGGAAIDTTAGLLGQWLGWDAGEAERAAAEYRVSADAEYGVPAMGDVPGEVRA